MASDVPRIDFGNNFELELEYNAKLYKELLNVFVQCITAVTLVDQPCISRRLNVQEMEEVRVRCQNDGNQAAARLLLEKLRKYPHFFDNILEAMDEESLRLSEFKPKFIVIRDRVNREWLENHPSNPMPGVPLRPPTQASMEGNQGRSRPDSGPPPSDFGLESNIANPEEGLSGLQLDTGFHQEAEDCRASGGDNYVDGKSTSDYETLSSVRDDEHPYEPLMPSLQTDAVPVVMQETEGPPQEVTVREAAAQQGQQSQSQQPRRPPVRREDHPSLQRAISNNPNKNFVEQSVVAELSTSPGWSDFRTEREVIRSMQCKCDAQGTFMIWYWKMARRPTLCIILNRKIVTFVIHKSSSQPGKYYINRGQKICNSLKELVEYHLAHGIHYTYSNGQVATVQLTTPYTP